MKTTTHPIGLIPDLNTIHLGDSLSVLKSWPDEFVQCVVTSPPYWGLRDYGVNGQLGLEKTPEEYVSKMTIIFREIRRVLKKDGTLWLNLGDSYASDTKGSGGMNSKIQNTNAGSRYESRRLDHGLKQKDLVGIPWRIAFALQADGWYLRSDIIWSKPNPMPESVTDRPTRSHEYIFLLSKSHQYFYDSDAIKEKAIYFDDNRKDRSEEFDNLIPTAQTNGVHPRKSDKQRGHSRRHAGFNDRWDAMDKTEQCSAMRNKRDVWTIATNPFPEAHFATFPEGISMNCIKAGSRPEDIILDPFMGSGTTGQVAKRLKRNYLGIELNPEYIDIAKRKIGAEDNPLLVEA